MPLLQLATSTVASDEIRVMNLSGGLGGCRAWGSARAGESFGASLGGGEACGWPTQRADNDGWHRKSPRPYGLTLSGADPSLQMLAIPSGMAALRA